MRIPLNERRLRRLRIRRGTEALRKQVVFEEGEPVLDKTRKRVFIGDSKRYGGNIASNINYIQPTNTLPSTSEVFDVYYDGNGQTLNMVNGDNLTHREIVPNLTKCCVNTLRDIEILEALMHRMEVECCTPQYKLTTDSDIDITTDDGRWIKTRDINI
jgi:hypothetical protein